MSFLGFFGKRQSPNATIPDALPGDSFNQAFKPYATNPDKPSAWGEGGKAWQILGIVGDALSAADGRQGVYLPAMLDMRQQTQKERQFLAQLQAKSASDRADKVWERDLDISRPKPTAEMQNFGAYEGMDDARRKTFNQFKAGDPNVALTFSNGQVYAGPQSGLATALTGGQQASNLDATPTSEGGYQYTPGPGGRANQANWSAAGSPPSPSDNTLSPAQWGAAVQALGPEAAEAWRRRNGIQIGGQ